MSRVYSDKSNSISLHRVAVVRPFTTFLETIGAPVEGGFRQAGLPYTALENVDNYVPSQRFWSFLVIMAQSEGIVDLGFRVGQRFGANSADPHLVDLLRRSLTMYQGLMQATGLVNRTVSHCDMGIHQPPGRSCSLLYHKPSCNVNHPAIDQIGWFGLTALISMIRAFAGAGWQPSEIGIMTEHLPSNYVREHYPRIQIKPHQPYYYVAVENHLLSLPPLSDQTPAQAFSPLDHVGLPADFPSALESILLAYAQEGDLSIEFIAGLCNMSKRTLQRRLLGSDSRFSDILARVRFRAACSMLRSPRIKVAEIAQRLGYSDSAHFARAFRRVAGVSPREFRQHHLGV